MAYYRSPMQAGGSYVQSNNDLSSPPFSQPMKEEPPERKSSKTSRTGTSFWSLKSLKRSNTTHSTSPVVPPQPQAASPDVQRIGASGGPETEGRLFQNATASQQSLSRAFVAELPKDTSADDRLTTIALPGIKVKYHIHNPLGPRWYKNYHLIPPSQIKPSMRPPSFFSPSFPPISTSSTPDNIGDLGAASTRASHSPQPTPTSSQTRFGEGPKPRSRKTSQTAPDNVDLLDVTDPWGTNWHHESPYDIGQPSSSKVELEEQGRRLRRASMTAAQNSFKAVTPSPLSQSTSAVHLHDLVPEKPPSASNTITQNIQSPRKLSKRRNPDLNTLFKPPTKEEQRKTVSAPQTPVERIYLADSSAPDSTSLPKRMSVAPPVSYGFHPQPQLPKKEKRTSVLGRLVKKFSLLRKSGDDFGNQDNREYSWLHVNPDDLKDAPIRQSMDFNRRQPSPEKHDVKRVPAPSIAHQSISIPFPEKEKPPPPPPPLPLDQRGSCISLESPFSIGKLTIANPDTPESEKGSPQPQPPMSLQPGPELDAISPYMNDFPSPLLPPHDPPPPPSPVPPTPPVITPEIPSPRQSYEKPLPIPSPSTVPSSSPSTASDKLPEAPNDVHPNRSATVSTTATRKSVIPAAVEVAAPSLEDSDSGSDSESSSSEEEQEEGASSVSNTPIAPESTVQDSVVSKAPTLPEKPVVVVPPQPPPTLPAPSPSPTPDTTPVQRKKSRDDRALRNNSMQRTSKAHDPLPMALPLAVGSVAGVYPLALPLSPEEMTTQDRIDSYLTNADSPYSATSVLANPPTPYNDHSPILPNSEVLPPVPSAPPPVPTKPPAKESKRPSREPSPRQTETFKLVRNHSGNAVMSTETIVAAGQQWEVVETDPKAKARSSKKEHHRENSHRKDTVKGEPSSSRHRAEEGEKQDKVRPRSQRHSKQVLQQPDVSSVPMPKVRHSTSYRHPEELQQRYLDGFRKYEEQPQLPPAEESPSKHREEKRRSEYLNRDEARGSKDDQRRMEEHKRREDRRRHEEEKRYEEEKREREKEREKERERRRREREKEREKDLEREREREKERERERQREREQHERERELEREREKERQRDLKEREKEKQRLRELERVREKEKLRERLRESAREEERERLRGLEREAEREREREKEKERDRERRRREREERRQEEKNKRDSDHRLRDELKRREHDDQRSSDESRHRRKREDCKSGDERKEQKSVYLTPEHSRVESYYANAPQSVYGPQSSEGHVERRASTTTRPTSELPSAADMNALRAKEAWDMERMWKARSMYGAELNGNAVHSIPTQSSFSDNPSTPDATAYGSSHTAFMVQTPFQHPRTSSIYHSMPTKPPPIIFGSPASIPSLPDSLHYDPYDRNNFGNSTSRHAQKNGHASSPPESLSAMPLLTRQPLANNPLPDPPRESTYQPAPLPPLKPTTSRTGGDYWAKYAGVATAH